MTIFGKIIAGYKWSKLTKDQKEKKAKKEARDFVKKAVKRGRKALKTGF